jgi:glycosyltransferase involved in cell wall biosynthesis
MNLHLAVEAIGCRHSGAATVLCDLIDAAANDPRFGQVSVFCSHRRERRFKLPDSAKINELDVAQTQVSPFHRLRWLYKGLPKAMENVGADVLLSMSGTGRAAKDKPHIPFIQQSLPFAPEALSKMGFWDQLRLKTIYYSMRSACRSGSAVIVQSRTMRKAVIAAFGLAPERVHAVSYAVRERTESEQPASQLRVMSETKPGCRLLYVGNDAAYKNVDKLLSAVDDVAWSLPEVRLFLTWPVDHPASKNARVKCLGYLDEVDVSEAYRLADMLVMPSLTETVGLPLLEAMTAGTPVLAADRPYAREVCEKAADFFDPLDSRSLSTGIKKLLTDNARRRELSQLGLALTLKQRCQRPYQRMLDIAANAVRLSC